MTKAYRLLSFSPLLLALLLAGPVTAQPMPNRKYGQEDLFRQLDSWLPTPNQYRTASGTPGPAYWQQRADYDVQVRLDDENQSLDGQLTVDYFNRSPQQLSYIWFQLDQNRFERMSESVLSADAPDLDSRVSVDVLRSLLAQDVFDGGYKIRRVTDGDGNDLTYRTVKTMMRVELPQPLEPGDQTSVRIEWTHNIVDAAVIRARGGYEYFPDDGNYVYEIAQWYPRVAAFTDYTGWQHKQFLGRGEFTLELGDYRVAITVPADHIVAATGRLQNSDEVLTAEQQQRLATAADADQPIFIVTEQEAIENQKEGSDEEKTWVFVAENVRDFAWASSRKFIWDAQGHQVDSKTVLAMSFYPPEAEPLWSKYSTAAIVHTLDVYSRFTFPYPYPVAISVNGPVYGMEYPMICFNGPRPEEDGTYSKRTKYGLISVIIHEVGHNWFPMIVNSDERQWTWMDEGLNTFLQYLAEQEWEQEYPSRRGEPEDIVTYMASTHQVPVMTGSESILQFGNNAYAKPATALNILRETVLGREMFDLAFKEYAQTWKFKRPTPADFFRAMEEAAGQDLDWFWRGWFYSTDHVDIAIEDVAHFNIDPGDPDEAAERARQEKARERPTISHLRNRELPERIAVNPGLKDFYNEYDELEPDEAARKAYQRFLDRLSEEEREAIRRKTNFYRIRLVNRGGVVMPVPLELQYQDGSTDSITLPAQIWQRNNKQFDYIELSEKQLVRVILDPNKSIADTDESNNEFPPRIKPSRFKVFKEQVEKNPMQKVRARERDAVGEAAEKSKAAEVQEDPRVPKPDAEPAGADDPAAQRENEDVPAADEPPPPGAGKPGGPQSDDGTPED